MAVRPSKGHCMNWGSHFLCRSERGKKAKCTEESFEHLPCFVIYTTKALCVSALYSIVSFVVVVASQKPYKLNNVTNFKYFPTKWSSRGGEEEKTMRYETKHHSEQYGLRKKKLKNKQTPRDRFYNAKDTASDPDRDPNHMPTSKPAYPAFAGWDYVRLTDT